MDGVACASTADAVDWGCGCLASLEHLLVELEDVLFGWGDGVAHAASAGSDCALEWAGERDARRWASGVVTRSEVFGLVAVVVASTAASAHDVASRSGDGRVWFTDGVS